MVNIFCQFSIQSRSSLRLFSQMKRMKPVMVEYYIGLIKSGIYMFFGDQESAAFRAILYFKVKSLFTLKIITSFLLNPEELLICIVDTYNVPINILA